jgi:hypothetical protein
MSPLVLLALLGGGPVELDWRAPAGCPDADAVAAELAALADLGHAAPRVKVRGVTRAVGERHELDLRIETRSMTLRRRLVADGCATLAGAAALLIAIALDPLELAEQVAAPPAAPWPRLPADELPLAVPADERPPAPPPAAPPPERPLAEPAPPLAALLRLEAAVDAGTTPTVAGDLALALGLLRRRLRVELLARYTLPRPLRLDDREVGTAARWAAGARGCGRILQGALEVPLCAGLEAGQLLARGAGVTVDPRAARPAWLAALFGLGVLWSPHPRVAVSARAELVLALLRAGFTVSGRLVHTVEPAGVRVSFGVELRLGPGARRDGTGRVRPRRI